MGFAYLKGKKWENISRSERLFCAHLYWAIKQDIKKFIRYINEKLKDTEIQQLNENDDWDASVEVAFYRDLFAKDRERMGSITKTSHNRSRVFDLCLFSNNKIVVIEAKVQRGLSNGQRSHFENDKNQIREVIRRFSGCGHEGVDILFLILCSSEDRITKKHNDKFDACLIWNELFGLFNDELFSLADKSFGS